jgi:myosin V
VFLRAGQIAILDMRRAEILDNAARHIQGRFRTFITRKEFVKTREASISIQAYCRGKHVGLWLYSFVHESDID